jgi:hypothetical protein
LVASNPGTSPTTGWPVGFWWAELTHPYWESVECGFEVGVFSPDGGRLEGDAWSDPRDESSAAELRSRGVELEQVQGLAMVDGIADIGFALAAWFVDPDHNSIGLLQLKSSD